jgi:hypothetical protein
LPRPAAHRWQACWPGTYFTIANSGVLLLGAATAAFWLRMGGTGKLRWGLMLLLLVLVAVNEFGLAPIMADIKAELGALDTLPKDDPGRASFAMWHGISAVCHLLASITAVMLVVLGSSGEHSCRH